MLKTLPGFYNSANAALWGYRPNHAALFAEAHKFSANNHINPARSDRKRIAMLLIDLQKDFCHPEGSLFVGGRSGRGAIDDNVRIAEFIYRNIDVISAITPTLDTHFPFQIFFSTFWNDANGQPVPPFTAISVDDIESSKVVVSPAAAQFCGGNYTWAKKQVQFYCEELKKAGKYTLFLWPFHCLIGDDGYSLAGIIEEACFFHSIARGVQTGAEIKGSNPWTENYSVFGAEVLMRHDGKPLAQKNTPLVETLMNHDYVIVAGQAASHSVMSSVDDLVNDIMSKAPKLAQKVYVMQDCMSAVAIPDGQGGWISDFTLQVDAAFAKWHPLCQRACDTLMCVV